MQAAAAAALGRQEAPRLFLGALHTVLLVVLALRPQLLALL